LSAGAKFAKTGEKCKLGNPQWEKPVFGRGRKKSARRKKKITTNKVSRVTEEKNKGNCRSKSKKKSVNPSQRGEYRREGKKKWATPKEPKLRKEKTH